MNSKPLRAAMTQTRNAYADMPETLDRLDLMHNRLVELREANLAHHADLVAAAARQGAKLIGLGELFAGPYFALERRELWRGLAEDARTGPSVSAMRVVAREHSMVIVAPIYELDPATGRRFNTAVVIDADGSIAGKYRKVHIPVGTNETATFDEGWYYERSDGALGNDPARLVSDHPYFPVFRTVVGAIGVSICYDRHFEGVIAALARGGAQVILSPAVTFGSKSREMWKHEFVVDAMRHRVFLGGSNRSGAEAPWNVQFFGASRWHSPDGLLANLSDDPRLVIADLDLASLAGPDPSGWNLARDARPDVYGERVT